MAFCFLSLQLGITRMTFSSYLPISPDTKLIALSFWIHTSTHGANLQQHLSSICALPYNRTKSFACMLFGYECRHPFEPIPHSAFAQMIRTRGGIGVTA